LGGGEEWHTVPHRITLCHTEPHCGTHTYTVHDKTHSLKLRIKAEKAKKCKIQYAY